MVQENFTLTEDMKFGEAHTISIIAYSLMFLIGIITNSKSLFTLLDERINKRDRSKMTLLLIHLTVADLTVRECQGVCKKKYSHVSTNSNDMEIFCGRTPCSTSFIG